METESKLTKFDRQVIMEAYQRNPAIQRGDAEALAKETGYRSTWLTAHWCEACEGTGTVYISCCGDDMRGEDIDLCQTCHEHQGDEGEDCDECGGLGLV